MTARRPPAAACLVAPPVAWLPAAVLAAVLVSAPLVARAHAVRHRVDLQSAVVVTLQYADGRAFAHQAYTLTPTGRETPLQSGRTDALGRVSFLPGDGTRWTLRASAADGHGLVVEVVLPPAVAAAPDAAASLPAAEPATAAAPASLPASMPAPAASTGVAQQAWPATVGLALIALAFGALQWLTRRRRTRDPA
jgi:nickel transport protein